MSKKEGICAGVDCRYCWQRLDCEDSTARNVEIPSIEFIKEPPHPYHRPRKVGKFIEKPAMYHGLGKISGYKCARCGASELDIENRGETLELHHVSEKSNGGYNHINNMCLLCTTCHYQAGHSWKIKKSLAQHDRAGQNLSGLKSPGSSPEHEV